MTIWIKQGVMGYLGPQTQKGFGRTARLYKTKGEDLFCTSLEEGNHMAGSLHYIGQAFDIRQGQAYLFTKDEIKKVVGPDFDVVKYSWGFHVEYDPKG